METKPKHIIQPSKGFSYYACVVVGFGLLIGSYFVFAHAFEKQYPQLLEILGGVSMILFGCYCIYYYLNRKTIYVFEDFLVLKSGLFLKKVKIRMDEVESWAKVEKESKYEKWEELYIFTASEKYCFASSNYNDYYTLKHILKKSKTRNKAYEKKADSKNMLLLALILFILGLSFLSFGISPLLSKDTYLTHRLVKTDQVATDGIKIRSNGKSSHKIELKLDKFPEFNFKISGDAYDAMYAEDFVQKVHPGDTLTISITKEDFEKKMTKTVPLDFWDKYFNYYTIKVYEVSHRKESYLNLNDYLEEEKSRTKTNTWILIPFGLLLLLISLFVYAKRKT